MTAVDQNMALNKKPQLRRCGFCKKMGHNKSTCPDFLLSKPTENKNSVKFFIHHLPTAPQHSNYIVDLKQEKTTTWEKIESVAPEEIKKNDYSHNYPDINFITTAQIKESELLPEQAPSKEKMEDAKIPFKLEVKKNITELKNKQKKHIDKTARRIENKINKIKKTTGNFFSRGYWASSWQGLKRDLKNYVPWGQVAKVVTLFILALIIPIEANSYYKNIKVTVNYIADNSTAGFVALQESTMAILSSNLPTAQTSIENALEKFSLAVESLENNHRWLQNTASIFPLIGDAVESRQNIISAGQAIAMGNTYLIKGISTAENETAEDIPGRLQIITEHLKAALPNYEKSLSAMNEVKEETLPEEYQKIFKDFKILFATLIQDFTHMADLGESVQEIFGGEGLRRYLLVFQNPHEIRPTGGFMGSFALLEIKDGQIIKLDIPPGGTYDLQGQLDEYVEPPTPLLLSNKRWEFQDANWFPDFPSSAKKILWFYRHGRNITADGVIAINATVLERLLSLTGPLIDEKRNLNITAESALSTIQKEVEEGPEKKENKPKQILSDLAPKFLEYFSNIDPNNLMPLLKNLEEALLQKEIQVYFTDEKTQRKMQEFGWGGQILPTKSGQDYLLVINTNIQGQKSDANMKQNISHQAVIQEDGSILNSVVITRKHTGTNDTGLYGSANIDYIRLYVPSGSELISAGGFVWPTENKFRVPDAWTKKDAMLTALEKEIKIDGKSGTRIVNEFGKTSFGNWIITEAGQTTEIQFVYRLPFKAFDPNINLENLEPWQKIFSTDTPTAKYQLIVQRQSGCKSSFESQIIFPDGWNTLWNEGKTMDLATNGTAIRNIDLKQDQIWSLIMKKE